jgi:hypothetical protein
VLVAIKRSRVTFDNAATSRQIGPIVVDYAQVLREADVSFQL